MPDMEQAGLSPRDYHRLVAPALKVCADLAAKRGDPVLYNDMPSMLALMALVAGLAECYRSQGGTAPAETLARTPLAACWMVLQESSLAEVQVDDCLHALELAYDQLERSAVLGPERELVARAWRDFEAGDSERGSGILQLAASQVAEAIDRWEAERPEG